MVGQGTVAEIGGSEKKPDFIRLTLEQVELMSMQGPALRSQVSKGSVVRYRGRSGGPGQTKPTIWADRLDVQTANGDGEVEWLTLCKPVDDWD